MSDGTNGRGESSKHLPLTISCVRAIPVGALSAHGQCFQSLRISQFCLDILFRDFSAASLKFPAPEVGGSLGSPFVTSPPTALQKQVSVTLGPMRSARDGHR